jgi:hypothetical protein
MFTVRCIKGVWDSGIDRLNVKFETARINDIIKQLSTRLLEKRLILSFLSLAYTHIVVLSHFS